MSADLALPQRCVPRPPTEARRYEVYVDKALADVRDVYPVPKALVFAVMRQESRFDPEAVSTVGARGLMQLMAFNARKVGVDPELLFDPETNILAGVRLLAALLAYYQGDILSALIAYNSHPRELFAPIPNNGETPDYCVHVLEYYTAYLADYPARPGVPAPPAPASSAAPVPPPTPLPDPTPSAVHFVPGTQK